MPSIGGIPVGVHNLNTKEDAMSNVECINCGVEAHSKCPYCRTVFPEDQSEAMLSYALKRTIKTDEQGINWLEISWYMGDGNKKDSLEYGLASLHKVMCGMADPEGLYPSFAQYACDHRWRFKKGEKSSISCGHKYRKVTK